MPRTQKQWIKRLEGEGWSKERGGKHQVKMTKRGCRPITLPDNRRRAYSKGFEAQIDYRPGGVMERRLHVKIRQEDGSYWATVDEYPGVLATGEDLEELRASLEEGIRLMKSGPGEDLPAVRLSRLQLGSETSARAELIPA